MLRSDIELASGLVRFYAKDQVRSYLEAMLEYYKAKSEEYGQQMGELLRSASSLPTEVKDSKKEGKEASRTAARGWVRVGTLPVNTGDTAKAVGEVTLKIVDEYKSRLERTSDALKSFGNLESVNISEGSAFTLFVNRGIPEALIVTASETKREAFSFAAKFRTV